MLRPTFVSSFLILCLMAPCGTKAMAGDPIVDPAALATLELRFKGNEHERVYLGVGSAGNLAVAQIKADRLIIAVFNTFCTICQEDAAVLNLMYKMIEGTPSLKGRTKLVGIAAGNTEAEVEQFREEFQVPFPLFADTKFAIERAVPKDLRTPMFITVSNVEGKSLEVVKSRFGSIENVEDFLGQPLKRAMLDGGPSQLQKN
ncbi:MAG: hypothetical protein AB1733_08800 [Thermodesulfobacteriota bacterium]